MATERLKKLREEPLIDSRIPHPYRELVIELKKIVEELRALREKPPPPAARIPGQFPPAAPSAYVDVIAHGLRKHGALLMSKDYHVEVVDLAVDRSTAALIQEFPKLSGIALTIFRCAATFDLYINQKDDYHKITIDALTYPQTLLIDWIDISTAYIGNAASAGNTATLIAWKPTPAPPALPIPKVGLVITPADREAFRKMGDVNRDGIIDSTDINLITAAFGSYKGQPNWNADADLNGDGKVDITDLVTVNRNFGLTIEMWKATR